MQLARAALFGGLGVWDAAAYVIDGGWALLFSALALIILGGSEAWHRLGNLGERAQL
jgi:hypothetical protein